MTEPIKPKPYPTHRFLSGWSPFRNIAKIPSVGVLGGRSGPMKALLPQPTGHYGPFRKWLNDATRQMPRREGVLFQEKAVPRPIRDFIRGAFPETRKYPLIDTVLKGIL